MGRAGMRVPCTSYGNSEQGRFWYPPRRMDWITASKIVLAFGLLLLASRADWRTREASDAYWVALGVAGMAFLAAQIHLDAADPTYYLILFPIAVLFLDIFWDRRGVLEDGVNLVLLLYVAAFATLAWLVLEHHADLYLWELMLVPIMFLLFILFYQFDLIKGGADAKALIALSIMFPMYPTGDGFPLIALPTEMSDFLLPFPLLILFNAALLTLAVPLAMLALNLARRDVRFPAMLFGYRMSIDDAKNKFVGRWSASWTARGGELLPELDDAANGLMELEEAGVDSTWTPRSPSSSRQPSRCSYRPSSATRSSYCSESTACGGSMPGTSGGSGTCGVVDHQGIERMYSSASGRSDSMNRCTCVVHVRISRRSSSRLHRRPL